MTITGLHFLAAVVFVAVLVFGYEKWEAYSRERRSRRLIQRNLWRIP